MSATSNAVASGSRSRSPSPDSDSSTRLHTPERSLLQLRLDVPRITAEDVDATPKSGDKRPLTPLPLEGLLWTDRGAKEGNSLGLCLTPISEENEPLSPAVLRIDIPLPLSQTAETPVIIRTPSGVVRQTLSPLASLALIDTAAQSASTTRITPSLRSPSTRQVRVNQHNAHRRVSLVRTPTTSAPPRAVIPLAGQPFGRSQRSNGAKQVDGKGKGKEKGKSNSKMSAKVAQQQGRRLLTFLFAEEGNQGTDTDTAGRPNASRSTNEETRRSTPRNGQPSRPTAQSHTPAASQPQPQPERRPYFPPISLMPVIDYNYDPKKSLWREDQHAFPAIDGRGHPADVAAARHQRAQHVKDTYGAHGRAVREERADAASRLAAFMAWWE